jgi:hypothetical protein
VPISGDFNELLVFSAHNFVQRGWSVIPLWGDLNLSAAKTPALPAWKMYQERLPMDGELEDWFGRRGLPAMGVVLGRVSGLMVIDIDTEEQAALFEDYCGDLLDTFTVRSGNRRLPHYYFRLAKGTLVASRYGKGIELRSEGQYVVAPGTHIDGKAWEVVSDVPPRLLDGIELRRILSFFERTPYELKAQAKKRPSRSTDSEAASLLPKEKPPRITARGLQRKYNRRAIEWGRNNALFATAAYARDRGWSLEEVKQALVAAHANRSSTEIHHRETSRQREREAERTIASVYKRPPRPVEDYEQATFQLPNSIREKLLQCGMARVARVLDGLLLAGFGMGKAFTAAEAYAAVTKFGIGKNTVFAVLKTLWESSKAIFKMVTNPSPPYPPNPDANAAVPCRGQTKQCLFGRVANPVKKRGRPAAQFIMPGIKALCRLLGVENKGGDEIKSDALQSLASYRAALHAALIQRAPGKYPRAWQAQRLGVSEDSCRRYDRRADVKASPSYRSWTVHWDNVDQLFPDEPPMGHFIEDQKGKRYPPLESIARQILGRKQRVTYKAQDANYYEISERQVAVSPTPSVVFEGGGKTILPEPAAWVEGLRQMRVGKQILRPDSDSPQEHPREPMLNDSPPDSIPSTHYQQDDSQPTATDVRARHDMPLQEQKSLQGADSSRPQMAPEIFTDAAMQAACANKLYQTLRGLNAQQSLTRKAAAACVMVYGVALVERGLKVLQSRRNIGNPAGFMRVWLRSEKKFQ